MSYPDGGYTRADMDRLQRELEAAIPGIRIERWRDYGYTMDVYLGTRGACACYPGRYGPGWFYDVEQVKHLLELQ